MGVKLTVIMPVYNSSQYLFYSLHFLKKLPKELSNAVEVLLIDDGSDDGSDKICDKYANSFSFVKAIHSNNNGPSFARNLGLNFAKGEWVTFIDSDDIVIPNYFEIILKIIKNVNVDMVFFKQKPFWKNKPVVDYVKFYNKRLISIDKNKALYLLTNLEYGNFAVTKIYRRRIFNNVKFPIGVNLLEDMSIMYKLVDQSKNFREYNDFLYFYRQHGTSLSHDRKQPSDYVQSLKISYSFYLYLKKRLPNFWINQAIRLNDYFIYSQYLEFVYLYRKSREMSDYLHELKFMDKMLPTTKENGLKVTFSMSLYRKNPELFFIIYGLFKKVTSFRKKI